MPESGGVWAEGSPPILALLARPFQKFGTATWGVCGLQEAASPAAFVSAGPTPSRPQGQLFEAGSLAKIVTSIAVRSCLAEFHVSPTRRAVELLGVDCPSSVTIDDLLSHRTDLPDYHVVANLKGGSSLDRIGVGRSRAQAIEWLVSARAGSFAYSNTNYLLLGLLIERLAGCPYEDFAAEHVLRPFGMNASLMSRGANTVALYAAGSAGAAVSEGLEVCGDAGLITCAEDVLLLGNAVLESADLLAWLRGDGKSVYGRGVILDRVDGAEVLRHSGSFAGFSSEFAVCAAQRRTGVVLRNWVGDAAASSLRALVAAQSARASPRPRPRAPERLTAFHDHADGMRPWVGHFEDRGWVATYGEHMALQQDGDGTYRLPSRLGGGNAWEETVDGKVTLRFTDPTRLVVSERSAPLRGVRVYRNERVGVEVRLQFEGSEIVWDRGSGRRVALHHLAGLVHVCEGTWISVGSEVLRFDSSSLNGLQFLLSQGMGAPQ